MNIHNIDECIYACMHAYIYVNACMHVCIYELM